MNTLNFQTGAPLKKYAVRSQVDQGPYKAGELLFTIETDDPTQVTNGAQYLRTFVPIPDGEPVKDPPFARLKIREVPPGERPSRADELNRLSPILEKIRDEALSALEYICSVRDAGGTINPLVGRRAVRRMALFNYYLQNYTK